MAAAVNASATRLLCRAMFSGASTNARSRYIRGFRHTQEHTRESIPERQAQKKCRSNRVYRFPISPAKESFSSELQAGLPRGRPEKHYRFRAISAGIAMLLTRL